MSTAIQPLLITPQPKPAESLQGFILRTSEANGYDSPARILSYAGMKRDESHSARPPLEKLSVLYGRDVDSLMGLGCTPALGIRFKKSKHQTVMGHTLPIGYFLSGRNRICPECVLEQGAVESFWELRHAIACPIHKKWAVAICPACDQPLSWFRRGLLACRCGHELSRLRGESFRQNNMLALLGLIHSKLKHEPLNSALLETVGFPIEAMEQISLATLLGMIDRFEHSGRHSEIYRDMPGVTGETIGLRGVADILSNWPRGLHKYLLKIHLGYKPQGLRGRYDSFYEIFFKSKLPLSEMTFLQKEFVAFTQQHWGLPDMEKLHGNKRHDGVSDVHMESSREIRQTPLIDSAGASLSLKEASIRVGLPPGVLKLLRQDGIYQARYLADPVSAFHEEDLSRFRCELMGNVQEMLKPNTVQYVSLSELMHMRLGNQQIQADVIAAVHKGTLKPIGQFGDRPGRLILVRSHVMEFLRESTARNSGLLSTGAAARRLICCKEAVRQLAFEGVLEYVEKPLGVYIKEKSLERFAEQYVSCLAIAKANTCGVTRVVHRCEAAGIKLIRFWNGRDRGQPFIKKEQLGLLGFLA